MKTFNRLLAVWFFFFHSLTPLICTQSCGSWRGFSRCTSFLVPAVLSTGPLQSWGKIISRNQHGFRSASFVTVSAPLAQHNSWTQNHADPTAFTTTLKAQDSVRTPEKYWSRISGAKKKNKLLQCCILFKWSLLEHQVLSRCYSGLLIYLPFFFFSLSLSVQKLAWAMGRNLIINFSFTVVHRQHCKKYVWKWSRKCILQG